MDLLYCSLPALIIVLLVTYVAANALHALPGYDNVGLPALSLNTATWPRWARALLIVGAVLLVFFGPALLCSGLVHLMHPY